MERWYSSTPSLQKKMRLHFFKPPRLQRDFRVRKKDKNVALQHIEELGPLVGWSGLRLGLVDKASRDVPKSEGIEDIDLAKEQSQGCTKIEIMTGRCFLMFLIHCWIGSYFFQASRCRFTWRHESVHSGIENSWNKENRGQYIAVHPGTWMFTVDINSICVRWLHGNGKSQFGNSRGMRSSC